MLFRLDKVPTHQSDTVDTPPWPVQEFQGLLRVYTLDLYSDIARKCRS